MAAAANGLLGCALGAVREQRERERGHESLGQRRGRAPVIPRGLTESIGLVAEVGARAQPAGIWEMMSSSMTFSSRPLSIPWLVTSFSRISVEVTTTTFAVRYQGDYLAAVPECCECVVAVCGGYPPLVPVAEAVAGSVRRRVGRRPDLPQPAGTNPPVLPAAACHEELAELHHVARSKLDAHQPVLTPCGSLGQAKPASW